MRHFKMGLSLVIALNISLLSELVLADSDAVNGIGALTVGAAGYGAGEVLSYVLKNEASDLRFNSIESFEYKMENSRMRIKAIDKDLENLPPKSAKARMLRGERSALIKQIHFSEIAGELDETEEALSHHEQMKVQASRRLGENSALRQANKLDRNAGRAVVAGKAIAITGGIAGGYLILKGSSDTAYAGEMVDSGSDPGLAGALAKFKEENRSALLKSEGSAGSR